jgi:hypothetical protein
MSQAFVYDIEDLDANGEADSHQSNPSWMLTFVRWTNRDPINFNGSAREVTDPLVVVNDCVSVTISSNKESHTPTMSAVLRAGDINYLTAVAPGDFVFVNIADWESKIGYPSSNKPTSESSSKESSLYQRAKTFKPINGFHDGFKGFFKVQSVRRTLAVNPATGAKEVVFYVDGYGFTEFNNVVYFNQHLIPPGGDKSLLFTTNLSTYWHSLFTTGGLPVVQDVLRFFIKSFIGVGAPPQLQGSSTISAKDADGKTVTKDIGSSAKFSYNTQFFVPSGVGSLLGQKNAKAAKDLYVYIMGIQSYNTKTPDTSLMGFVPDVKKPVDGRFYYTKKGACQGRAFMKPDYWNQVPVWSILQEYLNSPINEMFVSFRPSPTGNVMPTLTVRQIPFSSDKYSGLSTKFLSLPRWRISPNLIIDFNIGRDEAARLNFVQVFGAMGGSANPNLSLSYQIAKGNYKHDQEDIARSGLRPYVITSNFDQPQTQSNNSEANFTRALQWKELLGDALIGGHLRLNGTIVCVGIEEPIAPGDNLELGDTVFHIESVSHSASIQPDGKRVFKTTLEVSHGVSKFSSSKKKAYSQMLNSKMAVEQKQDYNKGDQILPGITDAETVYKDPFYDVNAENHNRSFDLPPKSFGTPAKQGKSRKKPKKVSK